MIRREKFITRGMLRAEPETLFVFGDNLQRAGLGGQAAEMRGEPNAVGIPTKKAPRRDERAFFSESEADLRLFAEAAIPEFQRLSFHLLGGGTVVLPEDGLGTGRAELYSRAPSIWRLLQSYLKTLEQAAR